MANQEHLDTLMQGLVAWNQWRREYPAIRPNLIDANLSRTQLVNTDLSHAILTDCLIFGVSAWKLKAGNHSDRDAAGSNLRSVSGATSFSIPKER